MIPRFQVGVSRQFGASESSGHFKERNPYAFRRCRENICIGVPVERILQVTGLLLTRKDWQLRRIICIPQPHTVPGEDQRFRQHCEIRYADKDAKSHQNGPLCVYLSHSGKVLTSQLSRHKECYAAR